jgi:hypothetical protein
MDEMRLGRKTDFGKKAHLAGRKTHQHLFSDQYLSGTISLVTGERWIM